MYSHIRQRFSLLGPRKSADGISSIFHVSASHVSSPELKHFLDGNFPGQYSVKVRGEMFFEVPFLSSFLYGDLIIRTVKAGRIHSHCERAKPNTKNLINVSTSQPKIGSEFVVLMTIKLPWWQLIQLGTGTKGNGVIW